MYKRGLWIDDIRTPPEGFYYQGKPVHWDRSWSVESAKRAIIEHEQYDSHHEERQKLYTDRIQKEIDFMTISLIDIDHDAGEYSVDGGDYIRLLDWLEMTGRNYPIRIHSMNPVGVENMRNIIRHNNWKEVY